MAFANPIQSRPRSRTEARYLGIDPGLRKTGYAILERTPNGPLLREGGLVRSHAEYSLAERVAEIGRGVREVLEEFAPRILAIEQVFTLGKNPKSALLMAHARGAILYAAADFGVQIVHFPPTHVKRLLTGSGKASKEQMQFAIKNELGLQHLLEPHDVADAAAIALCSYHSVQHVQFES